MPQETGFNIYKLWENLGLTDLGKIVVVTVKKDQFLPSYVAQRNVELAKRINQHVSHVIYQSCEKNAHSDYFFNYPNAANQVLASIFET